MSVDEKRGEEFLNLALNNAGVGIIELDYQANSHYYSDAFSRLLGYNIRSEFEHYFVLEEDIHPDDQIKILAQLQPDLISKNQKTLFEEVRLKCRAGEYKWFRLVGEFSWHGIIPARFVGLCLDITKEKLDRLEFEDKEDRYRMLLELSNDSFWEIDQDFKFTYISPSFFIASGIDSNTLLGKRLSKRIRNLEVEIENEEEYKLRIKAQIPFVNFVFKFKPGDKETSWFRISGLPRFDSNNKFIGFVGVAKHITYERKLEKSKAQVDEALRFAIQVFENSSNGIMVCDADKTVLAINPKFTKITGWTLEDIVGKKPSDFKSSGRHSQNFYAEMWDTINKTGSWSGEIWNKRKNGEIYPEQSSITAIKNIHGDLVRYIAEFSDVTQKKETEEKIYNLAHYDELTGLANRSQLLLMAKELIKTNISNTNKKIGVLYIDLDRFKTVNDAFGLAVGDELLRHVATKLKVNVRKNDLVSRISGDEFVVIVGDVNIQSIEKLAEKILIALGELQVINGFKVSVTPSIGISVYPLDSVDMPSLINQADAAMYHAKSLGKNNFQFYKHEIKSKIETRVKIESGLQRALAYDEFAIYLQPQIDINSRQIIGAEALIRWIDKNDIITSPADFIPIAEETGMIFKISEWVISSVCKQLSVWNTDEKLKDIPISINISMCLFNAEFINFLIRETEKNDISPSRLCIELTESVLLRDLESALTDIDRLRSKGFHVSLDDFGTGYSSLTYLSRLNIDELKIDKSFISVMNDDVSAMQIVFSILGLAKGLHLKTVAEGVETEMELATLEKLGCDIVQGYYFCKPLPIIEFEEYVKNYGAGDDNTQ